MSGLASILVAVEEKVTALIDAVTGENNEQNERLSALEDRVAALEAAGGTKPPAASPRAGARKTAAPAGAAKAAAGAQDA